MMLFLIETSSLADVSECARRLDDEAECTCESFDSSKLIEELNAFLGQPIVSVAHACLFDHTEILQFLQILQQSIVRQIRSIQDASRLRLIILTLDDPHYVHVDSHL